MAQPEIAAYNLISAYRIEGEFVPEVFKMAFDYLIGRHPALRETFLLGTDGLHRIDHGADWKYVSYDVEEDSALWSAERATAILAGEAGRRFDLEKEPLIRCRIVEFGRGVRMIIINAHHIVADGQSMQIIRSELESLYTIILQGKSGGGFGERLDYFEYIDCEHEWLSSDEAQTQREFWDGYLAVRSDKTESSNLRGRKAGGLVGAVRRVRLSEEEAVAVKELAVRYGCTRYILLLTCMFAALRNFTGLDDIVIATPVGGRKHGSYQNTVGCFVNTVPIRLEGGWASTFGELVERCMREAGLALEHQRLPFEQMLRGISGERSKNKRGNIEFYFSFLGRQLAKQMEFEGCTTENVRGLISQGSSHGRFAKFPLGIEIVESESGVFVELEYEEGRFDHEDVGEFMQEFTGILKEVTINKKFVGRSIPVKRGEAID